MSDTFDMTTSSAEENWRQLAKFGVERTQDFDMDETFGPVTPGDTIEGVIELKTAMNKVVTHDIFVSLYVPIHIIMFRHCARTPLFS